ncbi:MAG: flagellar hook protein FlgE [Spirochaetaceae bacterium]|nr:flagellar hook protein FlgE [Spirochaetaceae bacterium]
MMRSLYSGVSGLQNHQTRLDVIGNNVANVNTIGFKRNRVNFQDMLYQTAQGATRPTDDLGGINPRQVGLGVSVATIDTIHTQGSMQTTGVRSDLAIQGDGFFILRQGENNFYTRAGAFGIDAEGVLVNPANGMRVQGWAATEEGQVNASGDVGDLRIPIYNKEPARATTMVEMMSNLNSNSPTGETAWVIDRTIFDSFGNTHQLRIEYARVEGEPNTWIGSVFINPEMGEDGVLTNPTNLAVTIDGAELSEDGTQFTMRFDNRGALASLGGADPLIAEGRLAISVAFDVPTSNEDEDGALMRQEFDVMVGTVGSFEDSTTQTAQVSSNKAFRQDGFTMGYLTSFNIDANGYINGVYTNGQSRILGQIALATFTNPGGLEKSGDTNFIRTTNSGEALVDPANVAGKGRLAAGMLEMSNVDLSEEFVDMIVAQRGFQANSRGIQTADTLLQEILNLR